MKPKILIKSRPIAYESCREKMSLLFKKIGNWKTMSNTRIFNLKKSNYSFQLMFLIEISEWNTRTILSGGEII